MDIRNKVLEEVLKRLDAAGAQYHIRGFDGAEYGEPLPKVRLSKEGKHRVMDRDLGLRRNQHMLPYLYELKVGGDPVSIPYEDFDIGDLQAAIATRMSAAFGTGGTYVTSRDHEAKVVQVLLISCPHDASAAEVLRDSYGNGPTGEFARALFDSRMLEQAQPIAEPVEPRLKKVS